MNRIRWITAVLGAIVFLAACQAASPTPTLPPAPTATSAAPETQDNVVPTTAANVPRISLQDLRMLLDQGANVTLVDTRSAGEYAAGHIPGSVHIPYSEIEARYREISATSQVVLYCA
jgi:3-mercaptopyruvate sulfurtransferase SseA